MSRPADWKWEPLGEAEDPVPGDVAELKTLARRLSSTAETIKETAAALERLGDLKSWDSPAGFEFSAKARSTAETVRSAHSRYAEAGAAVKEFWTDLEQIQDEADRLLAQAEIAAEDAKKARNKADSPPQDAGAEALDKLDFKAEDAEAHLAAIRRRLEPLKAWHEDAGDTAARRIREAVEGDGLNDGFLDDISGALTAIANVAGLIAAFCGVVALLLGWIPVIGQPIAGVMGTIALIATAVSLVCHIALAINGDATWMDIAADVIGIATFGIGRVCMTAARVSALGGRARAWDAANAYVRRTAPQLNSAQRRARVEQLVGPRQGARLGAVSRPDVSLRTAFGGLRGDFVSDLRTIGSSWRGSMRAGDHFASLRSAWQSGGIRGAGAMWDDAASVDEMARINAISRSTLAEIGTPDAFRQADRFAGAYLGAMGAGGYMDSQTIREAGMATADGSFVDEFMFGQSGRLPL
ncbi:hypothetical protein [Streptomyces sp. MAR4 CNX-425]|uniref:hypothetical protein n=1 Tax=Streptomyces sp. MAR4 CNX-425 TaxID=3406343 RepID=UPI003B50719D